MSKLNVSELDFDKIKTNLKEFLRQDPRFTDYDFDGSGLSYIIDLLAYDTAYNSFYANMVANEGFLDSATLRESVISRAKALGYTPSSVRSARAQISVEFIADPLPSQIEVPRGTKFYSKQDSVLFNFTTTETVLVQPNNSLQMIANLELIEGERLTHRFTYDASAVLKQRFILPNSNVDTSSIIVKVQKSKNSTAVESYVLATDVNTLNGTSTAFFLSEVEGSKHEIYFGDGIVGKKLEDGNIVIVEYVVSNGSEANGIKVFRATSAIGGINNLKVTTIQGSNSGTDIQTIDSVKQLAPLYYETQNRAVTRNDYETLIKKDFPEVEFVRVWGGEDNVPPRYGKVFMSIKPIGTTVFSTQKKQQIIDSVIKNRNLISIECEIVEPDYLNLVISSTVKYNSRRTQLSAGDIATKVANAIKAYRTENLVGFNSSFKYSQLVRDIDTSDSAIVSSLTELKLRYRILPQLNTPTKYEIFLNNAVDRGDIANGVASVTSNLFLYKGSATLIADDGKGVLNYYRLSGNTRVIFEANAGTIDYETGQLVVNLLDVGGYVDNKQYIDISVTPLQNDILPERNQIILIDDADIKVSTVDEK